VSNILLSVFNETLGDVEKCLRDIQASIEKGQHELEETQRAVQGVEEKQKCKEYEDDQVREKAKVLQEYLTRSQNTSHVLREKLGKLNAERERTEDARCRADESVRRAHDDLNGKKTRLAVLKKEEDELVEQWNELSQLIAEHTS
jgi:chromosome segregation ATPase